MSRKTRIDELIEFDKSQDCVVIGTDEAGRGPLAGPVVAAAVYFPEITPKICEIIKYLDDSKKIPSHEMRKELSDGIKSVARYSIHECSVEEIGRLNILQASLFAMRKCCEDLLSQIDLSSALKSGVRGATPSLSSPSLEGGGRGWVKEISSLLILIDGNKTIKNFPYSQKSIVKGDSKSASIAAASILAKVHRDELMCKLSEEFPQYLWHKNKGYPTPEHIEAIKIHGECKWHRKKFLSKILCEQKSLF